MASFNAQALLREVGSLLPALKEENHPSAQRLLPLYNEKCVREIVNSWQTLQCIKQELSGLQASMQNMTYLLMSIQQKLHHPSDCSNFAAAPPPSAPPPSAAPAEDPLPSKSARGRKRKAEKQDEIKIDKNLLKLLMQQSPSNPGTAKPNFQQPVFSHQPAYPEQPDMQSAPGNYTQYAQTFGNQQYSPISEPFDLADVFK